MTSALVASGAPSGSAGAATASLSPGGAITRTLEGIFTNGGTREAFSTPAIADINGDGRNDLVVAGLDGRVIAYQLPSRTQIWSTSVGRTAIHTSPAIAELTGDGRNDVVVGTAHGSVVILSGATGQVVRRFNQGPPLHCPAGQDCRPDGFFATPAIADINRDGRLDIVAPSWDHTVYAWDHGGALLWRRYLEDTLWSSPAVADIDRDGSPEVILGGDIWAGSPLGVPAGGLLWVLRSDGSTYPGYPLSVPGQTVWSSPAVGDMNSDGWPEIVFGRGTNHAGTGLQLSAVTARTRSSLPGWPVTLDGRTMGSPALANLDGDGHLEVAATSEGGWVYALDTNGRRMWRACNARSCGAHNSHASPTVGDVDSDGNQEVLAALDNTLAVYDGATGQLEASHGLTPGGWAPASAPSLGSVDGRAYVAVTNSDAALTVDLFTTGKPMCSAHWATFRHDQTRSGRYRGLGTGWTPFGCPDAFVAQQYRDFLGRDLDGPGLSFWVGRLYGGHDGANIIQGFMGSPEFGQLVAPVVRANLALTGTYPASVAEIRAAAAKIRGGASVAAVGNDVVAARGLGSIPAADFVRQVYRNVYLREPTGAELAGEVARLDGGTSRGAWLTSHAEATAALRTAEVNVTMTYVGMLGRMPDPAGWSYWVPEARRRSVARLIGGFQGSAEYRGRVT